MQHAVFCEAAEVVAADFAVLPSPIEGLQNPDSPIGGLQNPDAIQEVAGEVSVPDAALLDTGPHAAICTENETTASIAATAFAVHASSSMGCSCDCEVPHVIAAATV